MSATLSTTANMTARGEVRLVTFRVGHMLLGLSIDHLQEINRHLTVTAVPHSPQAVRGVINLRGQLVTVIDLRAVCGLPVTETNRLARNLIVRSQDELIGLLVDQVVDTISIDPRNIEPAPANMDGIDKRFYEGVYAMENEVMVIVCLEELLTLT